MMFDGELVLVWIAILILAVQHFMIGPGGAMFGAAVGAVWPYFVEMLPYVVGVGALGLGVVAVLRGLVVKPVKGRPHGSDANQ